MSCPCCVPCFGVHSCPGQPPSFPSPGTPCPPTCTCSVCCNFCKPKQTINVDIQSGTPGGHLDGTYVLDLTLWSCGSRDLWYIFRSNREYTLDCGPQFSRQFTIGPNITVRGSPPSLGDSGVSVTGAIDETSLEANKGRCCPFPTNCGVSLRTGGGYAPFGRLYGYPNTPDNWYCEGVSFDTTISPLFGWFNYGGTIRIYS